MNKKESDHKQKLNTIWKNKLTTQKIELNKKGIDQSSIFKCRRGTSR